MLPTHQSQLKHNTRYRGSSRREPANLMSLELASLATKPRPLDTVKPYFRLLSIRGYNMFCMEVLPLTGVVMTELRRLLIHKNMVKSLNFIRIDKFSSEIIIKNRFSLYSRCFKKEDTTNDVNKYFKSNNYFPVYDYLKKYGFSEESATNLIGVCPQVETLNGDKLDSTLLAWSNCQFGVDLMVKLLTRHPHLLLAHHARIDETYSFLLTIFSRKLVLSIFLTSPLVITENVDRISEKIDYLEKRMLISKDEIAHSGSLSYTIDYIKERLEFLIRAGVYLPMKEKEKKSGKFKNPRLDLILNSSDSEFSTKVAGLTLFEFEVFQDLMRQED